MGEVEGTVGLIDVSNYHELGREVAARTGIRHESPQVILLRAGVALWTASHRQITAEAVLRAMGMLR